MVQGLVSVIIPTYKSSDSLIKAVDSVLSQTYEKIEIIVVDDNNPQDVARKKTQNLMTKYTNNDRVFYLKHEKNKNGSAARNTGIRKSKGEFICFLDDDDIFCKSKIKKQVDFLEKNNDFDAAYTWRYQNNKIIKYNKTGDLSKELLSLEFTPYTSSLMIKRGAIVRLNGFDESYNRHQDFEFLLRYFLKFKIGSVNEPLVRIIGNEVNNSLEGKKLEKTKNQFLDQFDENIKNLDEQYPGFRKLVYGRHLSSLFLSYFKTFKFLSATRIFIVGTFKYNSYFIKSVLLISIKKIINKRKKK